MIHYCNNDPCEAEATHYYKRPEDGLVIFLCQTCAEAFEMGQARPEVSLQGVQWLDDEEDWDLANAYAEAFKWALNRL